MSAAGAARPRAVDDLDGWKVLLPPSWITIPTETEAGRLAVARLADRMLEGMPRDEMIGFRVEFDQMMRRQLAQARKAGASHLHALAEPLAGVPVSASLTVAPVKVAGHPDELAPALEAALGTAEGVLETGSARAGRHPALRRVRRAPVPEEIAGDQARESVCVDYVVPTSERSVLLMTFTTLTLEVAEEVVVLFDAIASTLHQETPPPAGA